MQVRRWWKNSSPKQCFKLLSANILYGIILNFHLYNAKNSAGQLLFGSFGHEICHFGFFCLFCLFVWFFVSTICISVENKSIDSGCVKRYFFLNYFFLERLV